VKCKGVTPRPDRPEVRSERSMEQRREPMYKNRMRGVSTGQVADSPRSPYPSRVQSVNPAVMRRKRLNLPRESCSVSGLIRTEVVVRRSDRATAVSSGHSTGSGLEPGRPKRSPDSQEPSGVMSRSCN